MTWCGGRGAKLPYRHPVFVAGVAALFLALLASTTGAVGIDVAGSVQPSASALPTLCGTNPYFVTVRFTAPSVGRPSPAILLFRDSPTTDPRQNISEQVVLAPDAPIGSVYGLAYDWRRGELYSAAYHRRYYPFGPGGPGAIYRVNLRSGQIVQWATVDAGPDQHNFEQGFDAAAVPWVGRTGLGDIEIDDAGREMFAVNMYDGRIYRLDITSGSVISSFHNGAAGEPWAIDARPFGLGYYRGWLYHAVVNSRQTTSGPERLSGHVYRSRADGSMMREVAAFDLEYERDPKWWPWDDSQVARSRFSQPLVSDIEVDATGNLILGLRDRIADMNNGIPPYHGDVLLGEPIGTDRWRIISNPEFFDDDSPDEPEAVVGALAMTPSRATLVASAFLAGPPNGGGDLSGALWFNSRSGEQVAEFGGNGREYLFGEDPGGGDIESLCPPAAPVYLPALLREACTPELRRVDLMLVIDASTTMLEKTRAGRTKIDAAIAAADTLASDLDPTNDRLGLVWFNETAHLEVAPTYDRAAFRAALGRIQVRESTRIELGIAKAHATLIGTSRRADAKPVLMLLTDGRANPGPETLALNAAAAAKADGITIFTVGIGDRIDAESLKGIASSPAYYVHAPDGEDLPAAYTRVRDALPCPDSAFWP